MRWLVVGVVILGGCGKTSSSSSSSSSGSTRPSSDPMTCEQLFAAPPTGELLCDEHVMPSNDTRGEVHWRSWGLPEERHVYCDRYLAAAQSCGYGYAFKPPVCDVNDNKGRSVALFFSEPSSQGGANYPKCARVPLPRHKTVIVVSEGPR